MCLAENGIDAQSPFLQVCSSSLLLPWCTSMCLAWYMSGYDYVVMSVVVTVTVTVTTAVPDCMSSLAQSHLEGGAHGGERVRLSEVQIRDSLTHRFNRW